MSRDKWLDKFAGKLVAHCQQERGYFASLRLSDKLHTVTKVQFSELHNEDKICLTQNGRVLVLDSWYFAKLVSSCSSYDSFLILAALYFFHEAHHHFNQNIGAKSHIAQLKRTGYFAEKILLDFDLEADNVAVILTQGFLPDLNITDILNTQGHSLLEFPSTTAHAKVSVFRKSTRLVARRIELLIRQSDALASQIGSAAFFVPTFGGGAIQLYANNPTRLVGFAPLTLEEERLLEAASDASDKPREKLARLDKMLRSVLSRMTLV